MWVTVMAAVMIGATACQAPDGSVAPDPTGTGQAAAAVATPEPAATSASTPGPVHTPSPRPEPVRGPLDVDLAMRTVQTLSVDIGVRRPNTEGDEQTREMLTEAFEAAGWTVQFDWFDLPQGGQSANVVATWPGRGPWVEPHVLVGAHIDTVPGSPGANDNASGVGVLVAMAHQLADEMPTFPFGVVLVGFGAEEVQMGRGTNHVGSRHWVATWPLPVAMLSIDMVGNGPSTRVVSVRDTDRTTRDRIMRAAEEAGIDRIVADERGAISDHAAFARAGVPAAFLWTGDDPRWHSPADAFEHVDPDDLQRTGDLALAWLRSLTIADRTGLQPVP
jgi:aminopeptidase YwaD